MEASPNAVPPVALTSTAERVASILRRQITAGEHAPGARLSEETLGRLLQVSRNTLREAFRLLSHDGLLVHELHRGVFVPRLAEADLQDVFRVRRVLECGILRSLTHVSPHRLSPLHEAVDAGHEAATNRNWGDVGTANIDFHQALVALGDSPRADETIRRLFAETRLVFHVFTDPRELFESYIERNRLLVTMLERGAMNEAADALDTYLRDSERDILRAYRRGPTGVVSAGDDQ